MSATILLADVGNSRVKLCAAGLQGLVFFDWRTATGREALRRDLKQRNPTRIVVASTSPQADSKLKEKVWSPFCVQQIGAADLPLQVLTAGSGIDRLLAAWWLFEQQQAPLLIADCGTAFTLDVVDAQGRFQGGAIGAGLGLQEQALATACPHLAAPVVESDAIPRCTAGAVSRGTRGALAVAISGLADAFEQEIGVRCVRFLSGGDAQRLAALLPGWKRRDDLVLEALDYFVSQQRYEA